MLLNEGLCRKCPLPSLISFVRKFEVFFVAGFRQETHNFPINTVDRRNLFWNDINAMILNPEDIPLTSAGRIVQKRIVDIPKHYPMIRVDHFAVMPNHIHLFLQITADTNGRPMTALRSPG